MKRGNVRQLLINGDPDFRYSGTVRGQQWITDRYVLARAEAFRVPPKVGYPQDLSSAMSKILRKAGGAEIMGVPKDSGRRIFNDPKLCQIALLLLPGSFYVAVNAPAYEAWRATGLQCEVTRDGLLLWTEKYKGKRKVWALIMPMLLAPEPRKRAS